MSLSQRIKSRRMELNMTQTELAKKLGYRSRSSINKIEQGQNDLPQSKIEAIAKALKCPPAYLMGWEDYPYQLKEMAEKEIEKRASMVPVEDLSIRLEKALENKNMKILELSQRTGISENALRRYLSGGMRPSDDNIHSISRVLEISQDWLRGYDVPMEAKYYSQNYELSAEEECIITIFRSLNKVAQDRIIEYAMELNEISKYHLKK